MDSADGTRKPAIDDRRYEGRPLLRLLDCYVLALTGHLDPAMETMVAEMVQSKFSGGWDWKATLRETINLPPDMDERIRALWRSQPAGTDPLRFALAVSDDNFLPMLDPA
jgi:hypothetical protein